MNLRGSRVVVTGGAGFIGSELTRQLCAAQVEVCVVDNLVNGLEENLAAIPCCKPELIRGDVRDGALLREVLRGCDVVFHLACLGVRHSLSHPRENHDVNATGTMQVLEAARETQVRRFVHVSSSEVYGSAQMAPMTEDHPTRPTTIYGASKLAGESYARAFFTSYGFPAVIVRPFNAYGPRSHHAGDAGEVIPRFIVNLLAGKPLTVLGDGRQTRDFTFVADTVRGLVAAAGTEGIEGQTFNLGSGRETSIVALGETLAQLMTDKRADFCFQLPRPGEVRRLMADAQKAREVLGWSPTTTIEAGLEQMVGWFREQAERRAIPERGNAAIW